jgi:hypothetical protein
MFNFLADFRVGDHHADQARLQRLAVHEALGDQRAPGVHVFDLLGGDVLALGQLEDVLLAVHDLQGPGGHPPADVARVQPALPVERLRRLLRVLVVAGNEGGVFNDIFYDFIILIFNYFFNYFFYFNYL